MWKFSVRSVCNCGKKPMDVSGFSLSFRDGNMFVLPEGLEELPAGGIIIIFFDGKKGQIDDDRTFKGDNLAILHTDPNLWTDPNRQADPNLHLQTEPNQIAAVFPKDKGSCALYATGAMCAETIVDFVCWGSKDPNLLLNHSLLASDDAVKGRLWYRGAFVITSLPRRTHGGPYPLQRGGSISRKVSDPYHLRRCWYVCSLKDITPGAQNKVPRPVLKDPRGIVYARSSKIGLVWWGDQGESYELEIATGDDFTELVERVELTLRYHVLPGLPPGKYYWRVRRSVGQMTSEWSDTGDFTVASKG